MTRRSWTVSQPVRVSQVVSTMLVPGMYLRECGTAVVDGAKRKEPAERSRSAPKTLGESGRGRQSHSTEPSAATRALTSQSDMNA
jgi:hypothetical protein